MGRLVNIIFEEEFLGMLRDVMEGGFSSFSYIPSNIKEKAVGFCSPRIFGIKIFGETEATVIADRLLKIVAKDYRHISQELLNRLNHTPIHELIHKIELADNYSFTENMVNYIAMILLAPMDIELDLELTRLQFENLYDLILKRKPKHLNHTML